MFIVLTLSVMYQFAGAQCPANKVWTCRVDSCYMQECKCLFPSNVAAWTAITPPCTVYHGPPIRWIRSQQIEPGTPRPSFESYPNPVTNSMTISFAIEQSQNVSFKLFDMTGRLVKVIADEIMDEGENKITVNASSLKEGIYILRMDANGYSSLKRISVIN